MGRCGSALLPGPTTPLTVKGHCRYPRLDAPDGERQPRTRTRNTHWGLGTGNGDSGQVIPGAHPPLPVACCLLPVACCLIPTGLIAAHTSDRRGG
ncbi:hypothetical protein E0H50_22285 [Kribbella sindirgiensis]|uniref:Uncharacterized protein n=1 Tax=Kribbella sindirgiensis TaxID=1124744 RepID=A0A4V2M3C0_9ACTN|nr:hypothetical protein E0H50_22285 [Kribbella sindirgiensis]